MSRIAVLLTNDFEDAELTEPVDRVERAGHEVVYLGKQAGETVRGKRGKATATVDARAADHSPFEFDAMLIPGGYSPDQLRTDADVVAFVREFVGSGKPVAAICHAPQLLIEAGVVRGRLMTSWPSIKTDLINAGADWVDREVVEDGNLITSRNPDDLDSFSRAFLAHLPRSESQPDAGVAAL